MVWRSLTLSLALPLTLAVGAVALTSCAQPRPQDVEDSEVNESAEETLATQQGVVDYASDAESAIAVGVVSQDGLPADSEWVRYEDERGAVSYGYLSDDQPVGFWTYRHPSGMVAMQGRYLYGGIQDGEWALWHENGRRHARGHYVRGDRHGLWQQWHANGRRLSEGHYHGGQRIGRWQTWWDTGRLKTRGHFIDGQATGRWLFWDRDGTPLPNHTYGHPVKEAPQDPRPPVIEWDGFPADDTDRLAPFRPGAPE